MPPPPLPLLRTPTLTVRTQTDARRTYLIVQEAGGREDLWLRRDLVARVEADADGLWIAGLFRIHDRPNILRVCCAPTDARLAKTALDELLELPWRFEPVEFDVLQQRPADYAGRLIDCRGTWRFGFESSSFAGAWVTAPFDATLPRSGALELRVLGRFAHSPDFPGFGHLGVSRSSLVLLDSQPRLPGVRHSWLDDDARVY